MSCKPASYPIFALLASACLAAAARGETPDNVLMVQPMALALNTASLEYERTLTDVIGLGIRVNGVDGWDFGGGKDHDDPEDDYDWRYDVSGFGVGLSPRFYLAGDAPRGLYLGPRFDVLFLAGDYEDRAHGEPVEKTHFSIHTAHVEAGYKFIFGDAFAFGLFADAGYAGSDAENASGLLGLFYLVGGGVYLGWAF